MKNAKTQWKKISSGKKPDLEDITTDILVENSCNVSQGKAVETLENLSIITQ